MSDRPIDEAVEFSAVNREAPGYAEMVERIEREGLGPLYEDAPAPHGEFSIGGELWPGLSKLLEESGENADILPELILLKALGRIQQVTGKIIGAEGRHDHWDGSHLPTRLADELDDLEAAILFVRQHNPCLIRVSDRVARKLALFNQWHRERLQERNQ
jgi:hypothetical protein